MKDRREKIMEYVKSEDFFPYRLRAAYTIEAAAVMGICMIFIGLLFIGGIRLYQSSLITLESYERSEVEPQDVFRLSRSVSAFIDEAKSEVEKGDGD